MSRLHAFTDDALGSLDAVGVAEAIAAGEISAPEALEASIARVQQVDGQLHGIALEMYDRARELAAHPRAGYFSGVPTLIKDNVDLVGFPTQSGTDAYVASNARRTGDFAHMFLKTGAIPIAKSQLSEYGFSGAAEHPRLGAVRSPWDTDRIAGASSAGSAALVAAGAVPFAHGNDGGGSIRIPASVNGLVGLKPSRDRVAQDALFRLLPLRIVSDGVLTRTVRDTAAFLREAELIKPAGGLRPIGDIGGPSRRRLRIAVCTSADGRSASPEVTELTLKTAGHLEELGHRVEQVDPPVPAGIGVDFITYWSLLANLIVRSGATHGPTWDPLKLDNLTLGLAHYSTRSVRRLPGAIRRLQQARVTAEEFHQTYDVILTPTVAAETPLVGHFDPTQDFEEILERLMAWVSFTPWQNITGQPAISLPLQTTASGMPQGMMFGAATGYEGQLLGLAYELEEELGFASIQA
ncbi:amidase [Nocardioides nematodiphilus]|uniref:amidase n=1 Tax=Nocardioides nematodiphilus TaxID=2849669 RepID=UPI001CD91893|nr:amidase [Nocardioides nematodiphilus]MCA1981494.1 amidase [Nocardioides nematodiphilus]